MYEITVTFADNKDGMETVWHGMRTASHWLEASSVAVMAAAKDFPTPRYVVREIRVTIMKVES